MPDWKSFVQQHLRLKDVPATREIEIIEEVSQQLDEVYRETLRNGASEPEAIAAAQRHIPDWQTFANELSKARINRLSPVQRIEHVSQEPPGLRSIILEFVQNLIYGARMLRKSPRFTLIAALTMTLGIGATTAIFSVVNAVILQPLPYDHPERILWVWGKFSQGDRAAISPPDFMDFRSQSKSFEAIAAMHIMHQFVPSLMTLTTSSGAVKLDAALVTSGFFEVFGVRPFRGRTFQLKDEQEISNSIILSDSAWEQYFNRDPQIVGKAVRINQASHTVVGIMPAGFRYPMDVDLWMPMNLSSPDMKERRFHFLRPIARLRNGIGIEQAKAELETISSQLEKQYPESNHTWTVRLQTLQQQMVGDLRKPMFVIFGAVTLLLLIACVNVAGLLLARITSRNKEMAIRFAIGAGKKHVLRQLLAESLLLSVPSGVLGLFLAYVAIDTFRAAGPNYIPRLQEVGVDPWTLVFTFFCSLLTAVLVSIAPAFDLAPRQTAECLKDGKFSGFRTGAGKIRQTLAMSEIALSLILLAGAGLLLKSFWKLTHVDLGFDPAHIVTVRITLDENRYPGRDQAIAFTEKLMDAIKTLPGVESTAAATGIPLIPAGGDRFFTIEGKSSPATDADKPNAQYRSVTMDYFQTMSIPVVRGRNFSGRDHETSSKVVIVNEAFVRKFFPDQNPVGARISIDQGEPFLAEIIGIVKSTRQNLYDEPDPEMYALHKQSPMGFFILCVRSRIAPATQMNAVRSALLDLDPDMAFQRFRTMEEIKSQAAIRNQINAALLAAAAAIALILAAVGIYGVLSFSVELRQQEIGLRLALGASRRNILIMILRNGIRIACIGLFFGIIGALLATRIIRSLLFEVSPGDPLIFFTVSLLLGMIAIVACLLPAHRASRVDPLLTLRYE